MQKLHRKFGLISAIYFLAMSISGTSLVFYHELTSGTEAETGTNTASTSKSFIANELHLISLPQNEILLAKAIEASSRQYPNMRLDWVRFPDKAQEPARLYLSSGLEKASLDFDPARLSITGKREGILEILRDFHFNLMLGQTGRYINGLGACLLLMLTISGLALLRPGQAMKVIHKNKQPRFWSSPNFLGLPKYLFTSNKLRRLHLNIGNWLFPVLLLYGVSGLCLVFPEQARATLSATVNNLSTKAHKSDNTMEAQLKSALAEKEQNPVTDSFSLLSLGNEALNILQLNLEKNAELPLDASSRLQLKWARVAALSDQQDTSLSLAYGNSQTKFFPDMVKFDFDRNSGELIKLSYPSDRSPSEKIIVFLTRFHTGIVAGDLSKPIWLLIGLTPAFLAATGTALWFSRSRSLKHGGSTTQ